MPKFINWAKKNASQPIYEHAPQNHQIKSHTPTMGGVIFVFCAIFAICFALNLIIYLHLWDFYA